MRTTLAAAAAMPNSPLPPRSPPRRPPAPWVPCEAGPYRLPHEVRERLAAALADRRNREAAFALAIFLARFWSTPGRILSVFAIDRRALTGHATLGLTEDRIRGAITTLEAIGFLDRSELASGRRYQRTAEGLHRKPILFRFGPDYGSAFVKANARAQAARDRNPSNRRLPAASARPPVRQAPHTNPLPPLPQIHNGSRLRLDLGDQIPPASSPLEAALTRWRQAVEGGE